MTVFEFLFSDTKVQYLLSELSLLSKFHCLEMHTNEAKRSIQNRIDPSALLACQTADNCDKSYYSKTRILYVVLP